MYSFEFSSFLEKQCLFPYLVLILLVILMFHFGCLLFFFSGHSSHCSQLLWNSKPRRCSDSALVVLSRGKFRKVFWGFFPWIHFLLFFSLVSYYCVHRMYADYYRIIDWLEGTLKIIEFQSPSHGQRHLTIILHLKYRFCFILLLDIILIFIHFSNFSSSVLP